MSEGTGLSNTKYLALLSYLRERRIMSVGALVWLAEFITPSWFKEDSKRTVTLV